MTDVAQTTDYSIYSDITGGPVGYYMKLPTDLLEVLSTNAGKLKLTFDKNNATFKTSDGSYGFSILPEDENQPHECYIEGEGTWNKVAQIKSKMSFFNQKLNDQHIENLKQSLVEADPKLKHKIRRLESKEALNVTKRTSTRDSNKLSNPLKKNQKLLQLKDKLPSLGSAVPKPVPKIVPIPIPMSTTPAKSNPLQSPPRNVSTTSTTAITPTNTQSHPIKKDLSPPQPTTVGSSNSISSSGSGSSSNTPSSSDLELRKNIIHYLGPAPLPWTTLQDKFRTVGDKDLATAVNKVAIMKPSSSGPLYHLRKQFLSEIDLDWPNYTDEDKKKIRDLKNPANNTSSSSSSTSSTKLQSTTPPPKKPATTNPASSTTTPPAKIAPPTTAPTPIPTTSATTVKTEEILPNSNMDIDIGNASVISTSSTTTTDDATNPSEVAKLVNIPNPSKKLKRERVVGGNSSSTTSTKDDELPAVNVKKVKHDKSDTSISGSSNNTSTSSTSSSSSSSSSNSSKINHEEQLQLKKLEFDKKYGEYIELRQKIEAIQKQFEDLGNKLKLEKDKAPIYDQINQLYKSTSQPAQQMKEKHSKLHKELKELKFQVKDYLQRKQQV